MKKPRLLSSPPQQHIQSQRRFAQLFGLACRSHRSCCCVVLEMDKECSFERVDEWWKEEKVDGGGNETRMESLHGAMEEMEENNVRLGC